MGRSRRQSFLSGAVVLTVTVAVTKVIGALYKIPLGNLLDSEGMAHFYAAYNIYRLLLTFSTAGLPLAMSRMVSEAEALGRQNQKKRILHTASALFLILGVVSSLGMLLLSAPLSELLHDPPARLAVQVLAPSVLLVCLMAPLRGYTQGQGNMRPTAASELIESLTKAVVGFFLAWWLLRQGLPRATAAAGAIAGVTVATAAALAALLIYYVTRRGKHAGTDLPDSRRAILRRLLKLGIPITLGACGMSLITVLDTSLVLGTLQNALGFSQEQSAALYGEYTYGVNLFALPPSLISPVAISLIPAVTAAKTRRDASGASRHLAAAFRFATLLALPAGAILSCMGTQVVQVLYPDIPATAAAAAEHLQVLGFASICVCCMTLCGGVLQSCGHERIPLWTLLCGGAVKIASNYLLVGNPAIGIRGASYSTLLCYGLIAGADLIAVALLVPERPGYINVCWRPALAAAVSVVAGRAAYGLLTLALGTGGASCGALLIAGAVYLILALALGAVRRQDVLSLPHGEKMANFLHLS
ncbi:MAG: polysaccharide biosynthesis protein [Oscillospiraceae bacterium]|nr:polysaccharide biosynthesis protein [Oscillospiraceae bacterium]